MAGSVMLVVPVLIVFILFQRSITEGIATTGLKAQPVPDRTPARTFRARQTSEVSDMRTRRRAHWSMPVFVGMLAIALAMPTVALGSPANPIAAGDASAGQAPFARGAAPRCSGTLAIRGPRSWR